MQHSENYTCVWSELFCSERVKIHSHVSEYSVSEYSLLQSEILPFLEWTFHSFLGMVTPATLFKG